ncbi:hypothetical protein N657DRAFT_638273 [Parathielavia appendiculata]|uniref:Uncharacterized protein n=1 Tax=Parathielavia appendiculata TaxID=2587402 RepID=A0AAN6YZ67_9PEZI|nr:hypothetical protein N657DRAFT_638273 [Parathielavia appendiculata]
MYFDGLRVPLDGEFGISKGNLFSWVPARDLRPFDSDDRPRMPDRPWLRSRPGFLSEDEEHGGSGELREPRYASDQYVQYNHRAQDTHGPTPLAASNPRAQLVDLSAMPESNNTSNPEGLDPEDPGVCYSVDHETGNCIESTHDGHAHETYQLDGIGETPTGLRRQSQPRPFKLHQAEIQNFMLISEPPDHHRQYLSSRQHPCFLQLTHGSPYRR